MQDQIDQRSGGGSRGAFEPGQAETVNAHSDPDATDPRADATTPTAETRLQRALVLTALAIETLALVVLTLASVAYVGSNLSVIILIFTFATLTLLSIIALFAARMPPTTVTRSVVAIAALSGAATACYFVWFDIDRTPEISNIPYYTCLTLAIALFSIFVVQMPWRTLGSLRLKQITAVTSAIPLLALVGAWNTYVFAPGTLRPLVNLTTTLSSPVPVRSGNPSQYVVHGSITLRNDGKVDAALLGGFYTLTALAPVGVTSTALAGPAMDDHKVATAMNASHALQPFGPNTDRLDGWYPNAPRDQALIQLDDVADAGTFLEPGEQTTKQFVATVAQLDVRPGIIVRLHAQVVVAAASSITFHPCGRAEIGDDGDMTASVTADGISGCYLADVPVLTPVGAIFGDSGGVRLTFVMDRSAQERLDEPQLYADYTSHGIVVNGERPGESPFALQKKFPVYFTNADDEAPILSR